MSSTPTDACPPCRFRPLQTITYAYSTIGRFAAVTSSEPFEVNYSYLVNSDLLAGWTISSGLGVSRSYETHRDLLTSVSNTWNGMSIGSFIYANDVLARRVKRVDNASVTNNFGYNLRSEVTSAAMGTNQYGYVYDPIGNRISDTSNSLTHSYTANALNQYTQITNGGIRTMTYDPDGNLTNDSTFAYTWDAENRLTQVSSFQFPVSNRYDFMSRRVEKAVNGVTNRFVYDGWNLVTETSSTGVTNVYVWGMDLSGSLQGAGGIGGLLSVTCNGVSYYPCYDANGNITDYLDANGTVVAHREYDAFGNTVVATGALVNDFKFWLSTKYLDQETGLYYYGYRFYGPIMGRWLSRDPVGEQGGANFYLFAENQPVVLTDYLGLHTIMVDEVLPASLVNGVLVDWGGYAAGRIVDPQQSLVNIVTCVECPMEKKKPPRWRANITLTLKLKTEIVAKGVHHPVTGLPRTAPGVELTGSHEANHRMGLKAEFERFRGYYAPVMDTTWNSWGGCNRAVTPIRERIGLEWTPYVLAEMGHTGAHWDTWFAQHNPPQVW